MTKKVETLAIWVNLMKMFLQWGREWGNKYFKSGNG